MMNRFHRNFRHFSLKYKFFFTDICRFQHHRSACKTFNCLHLQFPTYDGLNSGVSLVDEQRGTDLSCPFYFQKILFVCFWILTWGWIYWGGGREREREWEASRTHARTRDWTNKLLVHRMTFQPIKPPGQGKKILFWKSKFQVGKQRGVGSKSRQGGREGGW